MQNELIAITLQGPFDAHRHIRRGPNPGQMMHTVIPDIIEEFDGSVIMPNPQPPITTTELAIGYKEEVKMATPRDIEFNWLFLLYLTDTTYFDDVLRGVEEDVVVGLKYMPANGSTNTSQAVTALKKIHPVLEGVQKYGIQKRRRKKIVVPLHGEVVGDDIDPFDAERIFVDKELPKLQKKFPGVCFVLEHISTKEAAGYVRDQPFGPIYATITPQHLLYTRKRIFQSGRIEKGTFKRGLNPSMVCWPLLKEESDRQALLKLIASGAKNVGAGTDAAPHGWNTGKLGDCGAAGCYPGRSALGMYAMAFESVGALPHLQNFVCRNIPVGVYELKQGKKVVKLIKDAAHPYRMPDHLEMDGDIIVPMMHGEEIPWIISPVQAVESFH